MFHLICLNMFLYFLISVLQKTALFGFWSGFRCYHRVPRVVLHVLGLFKSIFERKQFRALKIRPIGPLGLASIGP